MLVTQRGFQFNVYTDNYFQNRPCGLLL